MVPRMTLVAAVIAAVGLTAAPAGAAEVTGRIISIERVEPEQHLVVLNDGRTYRLPSSTVVHVGERTITLSALSPGQTVVIRPGPAVEIQDGQTVTVTPGQPATPTAPGAAAAPAPGTAPGSAAGPGPTVVLTPPAATPPSPGVRQTLYGRVDDVNDNGTVKIDTGRDSFKVTLSRDLVRQIREGDTVQLDMMIVPAGAPAASPR